MNEMDIRLVDWIALDKTERDSILDHLIRNMSDRTEALRRTQPCPKCGGKDL